MQNAIAPPLIAAPDFVAQQQRRGGETDSIVKEP
jgi:hypothetical protein